MVYQESEDSTNTKHIHVSLTGTTPKQKQSQLLKSTPSAVPDLGRTGTQQVAKRIRTRSVSRNDHITQSDEGKLRTSRRREAEPKGSTRGKKLKMPAIIRIIPHSSSGKELFEWRSEFDMSIRRSMVSEDLEVFLGTMEVVGAPGPVGLTDAKRQELPCSGVMTFNIQIAGRTTSVTAWVSPVLRSRIIVESRTLEDLGFSVVEEIPR